VHQLPQIHKPIGETASKTLRSRTGKLDNLTVRAPVTGRLTAMDLKVGEHRNRGERLWREITPETGNKLAAEVDELLPWARADGADRGHRDRRQELGTRGSSVYTRK